MKKLPYKRLVVRVLFLICALLFCRNALAAVSRQEAYDFAKRFVQRFRSNEGVGEVGWSENYWFSSANAGKGFDRKKLELDRILIREPDMDDSMQIELTEYEIRDFSTAPEKIAVIYLSDNHKDIRGVLTMGLRSNGEKIVLVPMMSAHHPTGSLILSAEPVKKEILLQKNLSAVPGVEIVKIAEDDDSYGFSGKSIEGGGTTFDTNPLGCTLEQTVIYLVEPGVLVTGLTNLPTGRFRIHCERRTDESAPLESKILNAIADAFELKISVDEHFALNGYKVLAPNPLPDRFRITKEDVNHSSMHGVGDYEGYSLKEIISNALHNKPFDLVSTNTTGRYDLHLEVWPEAYGEMAALEQLGFKISPTKLERKALIIKRRHHN